MRGKTEADAISTLAGDRLKPRVAHIFSDKTPGTVTAQDPKPGTRVAEGTTVYVNVSQGVKPVTVPSVTNEPYSQAAGELLAQGFKVLRTDVNSTEPKETVLSQDPGGGTSQPPGTTVTLTVSKGPSSVLVPNVVGKDQTIAQDTLATAGFKVNVTTQNTSDSTQDGLVLRQNPAGGATVRPGATVTIVVATFVVPPPTTSTSTTTTGTTTTPGGGP